MLLLGQVCMMTWGMRRKVAGVVAGAAVGVRRGGETVVGQVYMMIRGMRGGEETVARLVCIMIRGRG